MPEIAQALGRQLSALSFRRREQRLRLVHAQHRSTQQRQRAGKASPTARRIQKAATRAQVEQGPQFRSLPRVVLLIKHLSRDSQVVLVEKRLPPLVHELSPFCASSPAIIARTISERRRARPRRKSGRRLEGALCRSVVLPIENPD